MLISLSAAEICTENEIDKMLSYRRVRYSFWPKVKDWNWETIFYGQYRSIFNHCDIIGLKIYRIRRKKRKIRAITAFKVIQGHRRRYQSKARMRLPISDVTAWHPVSYRFRVIAAYCSNFGHCVFEPPLGAKGQRTMIILRSLGST